MSQRTRVACAATYPADAPAPSYYRVPGTEIIYTVAEDEPFFEPEEIEGTDDPEEKIIECDYRFYL